MRHYVIGWVLPVSSPIQGGRPHWGPCPNIRLQGDTCVGSASSLLGSSYGLMYTLTPSPLLSAPLSGQSLVRVDGTPPCLLQLIPHSGGVFLSTLMFLIPAIMCALLTAVTYILTDSAKWADVVDSNHSLIKPSIFTFQDGSLQVTSGSHDQSKSWSEIAASQQDGRPWSDESFGTESLQHKAQVAPIYLAYHHVQSGGNPI